MNGLTGEKWLYKDLHKNSQSIASLLYKQGMRKGDAVLYMTNNLLPLYAFIIGVWRANGILRSSYPEDEQGNSVKHVCTFSKNTLQTFFWPTKCYKYFF